MQADELLQGSTIMCLTTELQKMKNLFNELEIDYYEEVEGDFTIINLIIGNGVVAEFNFYPNGDFRKVI